VFSAASADPMSAACHALSDAIVAFGNEYRTLLAEVRKEFPALAQLPPHSRAARWVR
jgi:hypothetical protein